MIRLLNTYEWAARWPERSEGHQGLCQLLERCRPGETDGKLHDRRGADVLFFYANQVGLGAIQAAKEKGVKYIGFASDQNNAAPGTVVASVYFDFASMYTWAVKKYLDGSLKPVVNEAGIAEGIVKVSYSDDIAPEVRETVKAAEEAVKRGDVLFFLSGYPEKP